MTQRDDNPPTPTPPARYIMIGGFLGAGKSTAVLALARRLREEGLRVGLITNDQSIGLVDTTLMRSHGHDVEEIAGGCFCCRFDSLLEAAEKLSESDRPDVFIAEPVGSCTDLVATVSYPLRRIYGDKFTVAPLSVLVDPHRALRVLGLEEGRAFSKKVAYVYLKQLEEAELIVINKTDAIKPQRLLTLQKALVERFPGSDVLAVSARQGTGLEGWFQRLETETAGDRDTMPIDYRTYAEGEALLGWLNTTVELSSEQPFDGEVVMMDLAERYRRKIIDAGAEVAHLKMTLVSEDQGGRAAALNLVNNEFIPELAQSLPERIRRGELIVNLRAEGKIEDLEQIVRDGLTQYSDKNGTICFEVRHLECFRPAKPVPTWRMSDARTPAPFEG